MIRWFRGLLEDSLVRALLTLLILGIVSPSVARASCTAHYITSRSQGDGQVVFATMFSHETAGSTSENETPQKPTTPCTGAFCSGNPATPFSSLPHVLPNGPGQWAVLVFLTSIPAPGSFAHTQADANLHPVDHARSIFHPPPHRACLIIS